MRTSLLLIALLALPSVASATPAENGIFVNTKTMNGIFVNTDVTNGIFVNSGNLSSGYVTAAVFGDETIGGVRPWQAYKPGHYLYYPHIEGTGLAGWAWDWAVNTWVWRSGEWFEGTVMPAGLYNPTTHKTEIIDVRIADVSSYAEYGVGMLLHNIEVHSKDPASGAETWVPMCGTYTNLFGAQSPIPAIALRGEWSFEEYSTVGGDHISDSPYRVTFACASGALGKCAADCTDKGICSLLGIPNALGYKPWAPPILGPTDTVWRDYAADHQACTRMVRADYCGDGHSWTATGTQIDVYDRTGINVAEKAGTPYWMYEATWNQDGAVRIACERLNEGPVTCPSTSSAPWATTTYWACFANDGMTNPAARLGNLRRQTIVQPLPPITPIHF